MKPACKTFMVIAIALMLSLPAISIGQAAPSAAPSGNSLPAPQPLWSGYREQIPQIRIALSDDTLKVGESFEAAIWLQGFLGRYNGVEGYQLQIQYDPALIQPIIAGNTGKLATGIFPKAVQPIVWNNSIDLMGTIKVAESLAPKSLSGLFGGNGKVGVVRFKALKAGEAALTLNESIVIMRDRPGVNIQHSYNVPSVRIEDAIPVGSAEIVQAEPKKIQTDKLQTLGTVPEVLVSPRSVPEVVQSFKDASSIKKLSWAQNAIASLTDYGVVNGRGDGGFHPLDKMTRAEFIQLTVVGLGLDMQQHTLPTFSDVLTDAWYYDAVETAVSYGLIKGDSNMDGNVKFKPNQPITRAEIAMILSSTFEVKKTTTTDSVGAVFKDVSDKHWASKAILKLHQSGIVQGKDAKHYAPADSATRAEVSQIMHKLLLLKKK